MTYQSRIGARPTRSRSRLLSEGVASIDLNQRMAIAREHCAKGSVAGDWNLVERDVRHALSFLKRELESA